MKHRLLQILSGLLFLGAWQGLDARTFKIARVPEVPLTFYKADRSMAGIDIDLVDHILKKLGIKYKIILLHSAESLTEFYEKNLCDMVLSLSKNKSRDLYLEFASKPHLYLDWSFLVRVQDYQKFNGKKPADLTDYRVGLTKYYSYTDEILSLASSRKIKVLWESQNRMQVKNLIQNKVDLVLMNKMATSAYLQKKKLDQKLRFLDNYVDRKPYYHAFVRKSSYPGLNDVIKKYNRYLEEALDSGFVDKLINTHKNP